MPSLLKILALACLLFLAACVKPEPNTQLLVWVHADDALAAKLRQIRVEVYADSEPTDRLARRSTSFDVTPGSRKPGEPKLPFSFGILPGESENIEVVVRGYGAREPDAPLIAEQRMQASFLERHTVELNMTLRDVTPPPDDPPQVDPPSDPEMQVVDAGPQPEACAKGPGTEVCDPIARCGCNAPAYCKVDDDRGACAAAGKGAAGEACARNSECAEGLSCAWGACRSACVAHDDCRSAGSKAAQCVRHPERSFGFCAEPCGKQGAPVCDAALSCSPIKLGGVAENFCIHVQDPCRSLDDGVCDEAGFGTGFCAAESDDNDCCTRPRPLGQCDVITQCGCPLDMACRVIGRVSDTADTACREAGTRPIGSRCDNDAQCVRGADCHGSICKRLCNDTEAGRCETGACVPFKLDGKNVVDAGTCWIPCEWESQAPCMQGTVCAQLGTGLTCHVQPKECPTDRIGDQVCDETSRACAPGTDTADCAP